MKHHRTSRRAGRLLLWPALVVAATACPAVAQRAAPAGDPRAKSAAVARPFVVDVRDFGAKGDGKSDDTQPIQLAVDALAARVQKLAQPGRLSVGTVLIPASPHSYMTSAPIWVDHAGIEIKGEGPSTRVEAYAGSNHPLFLFGLRRVGSVVEKGKAVALVVDERYRPDLFGRLDASAAPAPAKRWGFRSRGDSLIQAQATPLSDGARHSRGDFTTDHWTEATALTIEVALEGPGSHLPAKLPLCGMGVGTRFDPLPFLLSTVTNPGEVLLQFATQTEPMGPKNGRRILFRTPQGKGVRRLSVQVDLKAQKVCGYVDGVQIAVAEFIGPPIKPGERFVENDYFPMLIGNDGGNRPSLGGPNNIDWVLYGLLISRTARYRDDGPGKPQRRVDPAKAKIDDLYRYFTPPDDDPGHIGHLAFTDDPATAGRVLTIQGGPAASKFKACAFIHHSLSINQGGILDNGIRDIQLVGGKLYGQNVAIAQVLDMRISGVRSVDAYHAIGSLSHSANYIVRLNDCFLQGNDSGYFGLDQILWARDIHFSTAGRATMRFAGCVVRVENAMVAFHTPGNQATIKIHSGDYGGTYTFEQIIVDYEGQSYEQAFVYCEVHPYLAATSLRLRDINLGTIGSKIPIIMLRDKLNKNSKAYISADNVQGMSSKVGAVVDVDSPAWYGDLHGINVGEGPRVLYHGKEGTASRINVFD